jgi:outer membrane protein OmpA-like peptidoglycan-associated protein
VSFTTAGFGARNPVAPNTKPDGSDDPDGRQKNRRVEIAIGKK